MASKELVPAQLDTVQQKFHSIAERLSDEPLIQREISQLAEKWRNIKENLLILLYRDGNLVYKRKVKLLSKLRPTETQVTKLKEAVIVLRHALDEWTDTVRLAQDANHAVVSKCQIRRDKCVREIKTITFDIEEANRKIQSLESMIEYYGSQADLCDNSAMIHARKAITSQSEAKKHAVLATAGSGVGLAAGLVLAPFTGGISLAAASGFAIGNTVANGAAAIVQKSNANSEENRAKDKRNEANGLRKNVAEHKQQMRMKEINVSHLKLTEGKLDVTCDFLGDVERMILALINDVEERFRNIQNVEMLLEEATLSGDALSIVLRALERNRKTGFFRNLFRRKPKYLNSKAEDLMLKIKEKWDMIESSILPHETLQYISPGMNHPQLM